MTAFDDADSEGVREPRSVTLATASADGMPSARVILLKEITAVGLVFGSSQASAKGRDLVENPLACVNVYWRENLRQVTVIGAVAATADAESDAMFADRTREARAVAVASSQSAPMDDPHEFDRRVEALIASDGPLARPEGWQGYLLTPTLIEFWQGSSDRRHRRLKYERADATAPWVHRRLQP